MTTEIGVDQASEMKPRDFERLLLRTLTAVKKGDFSVRMPVEFTGTQGKIADTLNEIIELNERTSSEIERISNVVGKEGKLNQRMQAASTAGAWGVTSEAINSLVTDLVQPTNEMSRVIGAVARGDLSRTMTTEFDGRPLKGEFLRTAKTVNTMVSQLSSFASEVTRVAREVGTEGKLGGQADVKGVAGTWKDLTDSVNFMASNLTAQVRNIAEVTTAVANGDLSKKITVEVRGEILELKNTINTMVDQLRSFASEVTRVAREVGSEGKLGGQADVQGSLDPATGELVKKRYYHVGVAVDTPQGLVVPVVRDADRKRLRELAVELRALVARTREGKATLEDLRGGTFTITNTGALGGTGATPIVNYPEVAILGVGRARETPVVRDGQVAIRLVLPLSLAFDHRVIDGMEAARFSTELVDLLEAPERLLLEG